MAAGHRRGTFALKGTGSRRQRQRISTAMSLDSVKDLFLSPTGIRSRTTSGRSGRGGGLAEGDSPACDTGRTGCGRGRGRPLYSRIRMGSGSTRSMSIQ